MDLRGVPCPRATDDVAVCPGCGQGKAAWSRTRTLVVSARRFDLLTGVEATPRGDDEPGQDAALVPAQVACEVEEVDVPAAASPTPEVVDVPLLLVAGADPGTGRRPSPG